MDPQEVGSSVIVTARNLRRQVNERVVLQDVSFELRSGEVLFVRGPSGVGKSLLLRSICCLDKIQVCAVSQSLYKREGGALTCLLPV